MILKVALVQIKSEINSNYNIELANYCSKVAKSKGANIILFPEMWSNGYTYPFKKDDAINQSFIKQAKSIAKNNKINLVLTALTKGNNNPKNSAFVISDEGEMLIKYDKIHTCDFGVEKDLESGKQFKVCDIKINNEKIKIGVMICYDREFPESARILMLKGAEIVLVPNACDMNKARLSQISTRAFENMIGIAMANYPKNGWGQSCAYSPIVFDDNGNYVENEIFKSSDLEQDIFIVDFDIDKIRKYREQETWGNAYRKVKSYSELVSKKTQDPFVRKDAKK